MLKSNLYYWEYSLKNPEPLLDEDYFCDTVIITDHKLLEEINKLREIVTLICLLWKYAKEPDERLFDSIIDIIHRVDNVYYNEYFAFWKTLDLSYTQLKDLDILELKEVLKEATKHYCIKRHNIYANLGFTPVITQSLFDAGSSRRQGGSYKAKLTRIVQSCIKNIPVIEEEAYAIALENFLSFSTNVFKKIRSRYDINFKFEEKYQGKVPDFVLKYKNYLIIGEAKHVKESGGHQSHAITELIDFISQEELHITSVHVIYLAFLDGTYFNILSKSNAEKISKQRADIQSKLEKYENSFFVNTFGLKELLNDIKNYLVLPQQPL